VTGRLGVFAVLTALAAALGVTAPIDVLTHGPPGSTAGLLAAAAFTIATA
jgi:ATP-dependent 26S proteasome regulatory subunit